MQNPPKTVAIAAGLAILGASGFLAWKLQPWMRPGSAVQTQSARFGPYEVQVWQRKTHSWTEPFASGVFLRAGGGQWRVFCLNFEDLYRPRVEIREVGGTIAISEGGNVVLFDNGTQTFVRRSDGTPLPTAVLDSNPPGKWWLK